MSLRSHLMPELMCNTTTSGGTFRSWLTQTELGVNEDTV